MRFSGHTTLRPTLPARDSTQRLPNAATPSNPARYFFVPMHAERAPSSGRTRACFLIYWPQHRAPEAALHGSTRFTAPPFQGGLKFPGPPCCVGSS